MLSAGNSVSATGRGSSTPFLDEDSSYKVVLPRLPTGNDVLNSVFLHADLSGRPYRAPDFRDALLEVVTTADIIGVGQYQMSHVWMVTCASSAAKQKLVNRGELRVKGRKCMVIDRETKNIKLKILWLPPHLESRRVEEAFQAYGVVKSVDREAWRCAGMEHWMTTNRDVALELKDTITVSSIPHIMSIYGHQCLVLIPGRPPLCLRCKRVGHVRRQCKTPRCMQCHRFGHSSDACVSTYASKLRSGQSSAEEPHLDHLMDATEVVDATGEATGEAVGDIKEDQHLSMEAMPSSHNNTAKDISEDISDEITAGEHSLEELKEKPPDDEGEEEAMDSSQTRKRPAPLSDEATTSASDATEQMSSCGPRVVSFGDRGSRRLCQRPQESAAKKCKGGKATGCPVAKGDQQKL
ncbi:uncharacterized protein LOC119398032 [Rhipicephalus sanguineus]|uniref:uncharacterized protein LOC119398032 n=1 Tax=Rhipicephalus sanguineus TaxID=34632 RepID=UPI0018931355|nr:uncharacterized protein LOC119398032 [Rhipicephalus sanguineus]